MKILIVVDMQKDFVDGALGTAEAVATVEPVTELIENGGFDVVFATRDTHAADYLATREGKHLPVEHCIENTPGWEIVPPVAVALEKAGAVVLDKPTFGSVELVEKVKAVVKDEADTAITLVGLCTDICVVSNAMLLKAALPEADFAVVAKACAGVTPESHNAALQTMGMCQIEIL